MALFTRYTAHPVVYTGMGDCEVLKPDMVEEYGEANFWTVYGVDEDGCEMAIGDFTTEDMATAVRDCLNAPIDELAKLK